MTGRVVVGVDGTEGSRRALTWALREAERRSSQLDAIIVWHYPYWVGGLAPYPLDATAFAEGAKQTLADAIAEAGARPGADVQPVVLHGDPAETLCARATGADMLVVGSRGHNRVTGLLLGSVSTWCAHHSRNPVVIVPNRGDDDAVPPVADRGRIVVGIDGSDHSWRALRWAVGEARIHGATVQALSIRHHRAGAGDGSAIRLPTPPSSEHGKPRAMPVATTSLQSLVSDVAGSSPVKVEVILSEGDPAEVLCQHAAAADMLVVGSKGHGMAGRPFGSVSDDVAQHSPSPVVIVPEGQAGRVADRSSNAAARPRAAASWPSRSSRGSMAHRAR